MEWRLLERRENDTVAQKRTAELEDDARQKELTAVVLMEAHYPLFNFSSKTVRIRHGCQVCCSVTSQPAWTAEGLPCTLTLERANR